MSPHSIVTSHIYLTRKLNFNLFSILLDLIPMRGSKVIGNNLGVGLGCRGDVQRLPGRCARVAGEMCKGCRGDVQRLPGRCAKEQK